MFFKSFILAKKNHYQKKRSKEERTDKVIYVYKNANKFSDKIHKSNFPP